MIAKKLILKNNARLRAAGQVIQVADLSVPLGMMPFQGFPKPPAKPGIMTRFREKIIRLCRGA